MSTYSSSPTVYIYYKNKHTHLSHTLAINVEYPKISYLLYI